MDASTARALHLIPFGASREKVGAHVGRDGSAGATLALAGNRMLTKPSEYNTLGAAEMMMPMETNHIFDTEVQLLSLRTFERNVRIKLGGLVMAR